MGKKILLLRFSSFGDVTQCLSLPAKLKEMDPNCKIHWVTKSEFSELIEAHPCVDKIWPLQKRKSFKDLFHLIGQLRNENFSHIYDAHNSLRSKFILFFLIFPLHLTRFWNPPLVLRKSQKRIHRFLLFRFRINLFKQPFSGQRDLLEPLKKWHLSEDLPKPPQIIIEKLYFDKVNSVLSDFLKGSDHFVCLAPSAAHELKKWPQDYWIKLISMHPKVFFVLLGGPKDQFLADIQKTAPERVFNSAGKFSLKESAAFVALSKALVANDTGVLHLAEQLGKKAVALMGPAPFGFPSRPSTKILELHLPCRPCSKHGQGPCKNVTFHECLRGISPELVSFHLNKMLLD
jgi:ADP-heptose:LPS heptosyltransferase